MKAKRRFRMASVCLILILLVTALAACTSQPEPAKTAAPTHSGARSSHYPSDGDLAPGKDPGG